MWTCPVCSGTEKKEDQCVKCGFDERSDFIGYRTVCFISERDLERRKSYKNKSTLKNFDGHYKGAWKHGPREGQGIQYRPNGYRYEGKWKNGKAKMRKWKSFSK